MSIISDIVMKHIFDYDREKTGRWIEAKFPPKNTFDIYDLCRIGRAIISELGGN
jgi:hypothetical protein